MKVHEQADFDTTGKTLDPWQVLSSVLSEEDSDTMINVIQKTGMIVDWSLAEGESFSHKTRRRAYIPRIQSAYSSLTTSDDKLRVSYIVAKALIGTDATANDKLNNRLAPIGWRFEGGRLYL